MNFFTMNLVDYVLVTYNLNEGIVIDTNKNYLHLSCKKYHEYNYFTCIPIKCNLNEKNYCENLISTLECQNSLFE